ncbi:MAG: response regulator [Microscillaceae bacterium]|nr:response regulator [Microscillaceae bacterium]
MAYTTLLLDDEPLALDRLRRLLAQYPDDFKLVGQAQNGEEGRQMIESLRPQVIFLDIEMPVLNGFEMLARLQHLPYVILPLLTKTTPSAPLKRTRSIIS